MTKELMQMALDALDKAAEKVYSQNDDDEIGHARRALRARLAQPEPEPVAWVDKVWIERPDLVLNLDVGKLFSRVGFEHQVPLYTAPPQREWQGLTDEEIREFEIWLDNDEEEHGWNPPENIVKYLEAKLKEKNSDRRN